MLDGVIRIMMNVNKLLKDQMWTKNVSADVILALCVVTITHCLVNEVRRMKVSGNDQRCCDPPHPALINTSHLQHCS